MGLTRNVVRQIFFTLLTLLLSSPSFAVEKPSVPEQIRWAIEGRDLLLSRRYEETEKFLRKLVNDWPEELLGYFGLMALYQVRNLDNFDFRFDGDYLLWEEKGRRMAHKIIREPEARPWDLLVAGGTLGVAGFYRAHNSRWFAGLRDGSSAVHAIEKSFEKDSNLGDALLGLGLYDYWRSHFTRRLRFLPFFPDRRKEGRAKLERALRETEFSSVLADISLAFIDFEEKKYQRVLETTTLLLKRYPRNTILRMLKGQVLLALKKYPEAIKVFEEILAIDSQVTKSHLFLGIAYAKEKKDLTRARAFLKLYLDLEPQAPTLWRRPALRALKKLESDS